MPAGHEVHNNPDYTSSIFGVQLSAQEYNSIFENPPSFYEKKAFVDVFRRKWKEDKGYCSLF